MIKSISSSELDAMPEHCTIFCEMNPIIPPGDPFVTHSPGDLMPLAVSPGAGGIITHHNIIPGLGH